MVTLQAGRSTSRIWLRLQPSAARHNNLSVDALRNSKHIFSEEVRYDKPNNVSSEVLRVSNARKKVLAFSLYGATERYTTGAIENAKLYKQIYPGWAMLVYHDLSVPAHVLSTLASHAVQLYDMSSSRMNKMSWRFTAGSQPHTECFCSRDIDSRLSLREKLAVDEWVESGKKIHVMRDHPSHSNFAMSGGMWCASAAAFPFIARHLNQTSTENVYLQDMNWLNERIWPGVVKDVLQHDSFSCDRFGGGLPFPSVRIGWQHVGSVYINGEIRQEDINILKKAKNPLLCTHTTPNLNFTTLGVDSNKVLYILNIPSTTKYRHQSEIHPLVCISTSQSGPSIVRVNVPDNWSQLGRRLLLAIPDIYSKYNASWYFKDDMDTAVDTKRLESALSELSSDIEYVGQVYSYSDFPKYASGGAGYGIRRSALGKLHTANCPLVPSRSTNYDDVTIGNCLYKYGVSVVQLDGLYGDDVKQSASLASGVLKYPNHVFPVNITVPVLTIHKSDMNCTGLTITQCLQ